MRHITTLTLLSGGATVEIRSYAEVIQALLEAKFLHAYVPSVHVTERVENPDCSINVALGDSWDISVGFPYSVITLKKLSVVEIITLAEYMLERARQDRGVYCLHASAALWREEAYVFWGGASGTGKSSLALSIAGRPDGVLLYDEKVLLKLSSFCTAGGVEMVYQTREHHQSLIDKIHMRSGSNQDSPNYSIRRMILPVVHHFGGLGTHEHVEEEKYAWHLYEELSRKIRGVSRTFFGVKTAASLDSDQIADERLRQVKLFCSQVPCEYVIGSINSVTDFLTSS